MSTKGTGDIKDHMWQICKDTVSAHVLMSLPITTPVEVESFVVVSTPTALTGLTDYTELNCIKGNVTFTLFAKDRQNAQFGGEENTALLNKMTKDLREAVLATNAASDYHFREIGFYEVKSSYLGYKAVMVIYEAKLV